MEKYVQQIMIGTCCSDHQKAVDVLRRIKAAGYDGIEINNYMTEPASLFLRMITRFGGMSVGSCGKLDWVSLKNESGIKVATLSTDLGTLEKDPDSLVKKAKLFGTERIVITGVYNYDFTDEAQVKGLTDRLNRVGKLLKEKEISLLYHNHNVELLKVRDDLCAYQMLIEELDPEYVNFEFDSFWFTEAGADAAFWMRKLGKRMKLWHVTDRGSRHRGKVFTPIIKSDSVELGYGNMNLKGLLEIAEENGTSAVILESHKNWIDKDPIKSIEISSKWLNENVE